jgi:ribonuclease I
MSARARSWLSCMLLMSGGLGDLPHLRIQFLHRKQNQTASSQLMPHTSSAAINTVLRLTRAPTTSAPTTPAPTPPPTAPTPVPTVSELQQQANEQFDMYVLALSWQPGICHAQPSLPMCRHASFFMDESLTVQGFWPSVTGQLFPTYCARHNAYDRVSTKKAIDMVGRENLALLWPDVYHSLAHWRQSEKLWGQEW